LSLSSEYKFRSRRDDGDDDDGDDGGGDDGGGDSGAVGRLDTRASAFIVGDPRGRIWELPGESLQAFEERLAKDAKALHPDDERLIC
jgi:hypothetical protein